MIIVFLGAPGSGKGTQAKNICNAFNLSHISTGDLLRAEMAAKTPLGLKISDIVEKGNLVSDDIVLDLIKNAFSSQDRVLVDGYPRNLGQGQDLDAWLKTQGKAVTAAVYLNVPGQELVARMLARGRTDDTESTIQTRLQVYEQQTKPLLTYYRDQNKLCEINGLGDIREISLRIESALTQVVSA